MGFAFVTFEEPSLAIKAVSTLKDLEIDGRKINVEQAAAPGERTSTSTRGRSFRGRVRRPSKPRGPPSETVVFVGNLPFTATDENLMEFFGSYGVNEAHVVRYKSGKSKGFGFLTFAEAAKQKSFLEKPGPFTIDDRTIIFRAAYSEEPFRATEEADQE